MSPHRRSLARAALARLLPVLILIGLSGMAWAHAVVTGSEPPDGAVLDRQPPEAVIHFDEPVSVIGAQVLSPEGHDVLGPGAARTEGPDLRLALPPGLPDGSYTVSYRVVSLDGHPVAGSLVFSLGAVSRAAAPVTADATGAWRVALAAARTALDLTILGAAGGVLFLLLARPEAESAGPVRRLSGTCALVGLVAAAVALGVQGGLLLGGPARLLIEGGTWRAGIGSTFGRTALCAMGGLAMIRLGAARRAGDWATPLGLGGAALALGSFTLSGHVVTAGPRWAMSPLLLFHVAAVAFWAGSLLPLQRALTAPATRSLPLVERFSRQALAVVPLLLLAGAAIAVVQVRRPEALAATTYGRLLLAKLALVAALLALAALNRRRLTPALRRDEPGAAARLGLSIRAEIVLMAGAVALAASLGTTPPPRVLGPDGMPSPGDRHAHAEHGTPPEGLAVRLEAEGLAAALTLRPGRPGANDAGIELRGADGAPLDPMEVTLRLSSPALGVEPLERKAERVGPSAWQVPGLVIGTPGEWVIEIGVLVSDFERRTARAAVEVP